jgi:hypothetical protein
LDEIDIAVLDMSAFEFKIECDNAYKHKGNGVLMHTGPSEATHIIYATCGYCGAKSEERNVCLSFIEQAYSSERILYWRCADPCRAQNRYATTLTIVGCI